MQRHGDVYQVKFKILIWHQGFVFDRASKISAWSFDKLRKAIYITEIDFFVAIRGGQFGIFWKKILVFTTGRI